MPLWTGAVAVGLLVGIGWAYWPADTASDPSPQATTVERFVGELEDSGKLPATASEAPDGIHASFGFCHVGGGTNCVVDGDTLYLEGVKIRIADIDAPETHDPKCASEQELGDRATQRLIRLVNSGEVTLSPIGRDEDGYGRKLRIVMVDGVSVGKTLVGEGLARWYEGGRRPWC